MTILATDAIQTVAGKPILNSTGSILQVAYREYTGSFSSSTLYTYEVFYSLDVIATANSSRYLLMGNTHSHNATTNGRCSMGYSVIFNNDATTVIRILGVDGTSGDSWGYPSGFGNVGCYMDRQAIYTSRSLAGTRLTFNFLVSQWEGTGTFNYPGYNHKSTFTVMEISA
jgi:hypothetical protein